MVGRQAGDQRGDAIAQLQREVRRGGAHQLAHVLDGHLVRLAALQAIGIFGLAHALRGRGAGYRRSPRLGTQVY